MNYEAILKKFAGDADLMRSVAEVFLNEQETLLMNLTEAVRRRACPDIEKAAHSLKGAAANFSSTLVTEKAAKLELLGRGKDLLDADDLVISLKRECENLCAILETLIQEEAA